MRILDTQKGGSSLRGWLWSYVSVEHSGNPVVVFECHAGRGAKYPLAFLSEWAGGYAREGSHIDIVAKSQARGMEIWVINQGETIAPWNQERIFDRFYRAYPSRKDSAHSSGLGLSIVSSIMQLHKGRCWVGSRDGVTCFGLLFPISASMNGNK